MADKPLLVRGRDDVQFPLRLPDNFRAMIKLAAKENGRSMNSELLHRLLAYGSDDRLARIEKAIERIEARLK